MPSYGQSEIGVNAGLNRSGFYGLKREDFTTRTAKSYMNYIISVYYKEPVSERAFAGFELENMQVKSHLDYVVLGNHFFGYEINALFHLNYINLYFLFGGKFFTIKKATVFGGISPYYGYLIHNKGEGTDTPPKTVTLKDSTGVEYTYYYTVTRDINEAKVLRKANIGIRLNLDIHVPMKEKLTLSLKPMYNFGFYNVLNQDGVTGIGGFSFTAGLIYHLDKKYLRLSENAKATH